MESPTTELLRAEMNRLRQQVSQLTEANRRRAKTEATLEKRLVCEKMVAEISTLAVTAEDADIFRQRCLEIMGTTLDLCRTYIFEHRHETDTLDNTFEWCAPAILPQKEFLQAIPAQEIPWWSEVLTRHEVIRYRDIEEIPGEREKEILRAQDIKSILAVPLFIGKKYHGFMGFDECRRHREWPEEDVVLLRTIAEIITGMLERERSHRALIRSETLRSEEFRALVENAPDTIGAFDRDLRRVYLNPNLERITGKSAAELIGRPIEFSGYPEAFLKPFNEALVRVFSTGREETVDLCLDTSQGRIFLQTRCAPVRASDGSVDRVIAIGRDVTAQKRSEEALRRSEELYRSIVRNFPGAAIYVLDRDMRLMAVEGAVFGRISMGREQMEGKPLREVLDEDLCRIIEPRYRLVLEGRTCSYETVYLGRVFLSSYVPLRDPQGQVAGGLVVAIDITERKSMEEELRKARDELELRVKQRTAELLERNEQLALAQRAARAGFWILDQNSGRVYSSEGWKGIMGISADQEHCESDLKRLVHPGDWTRLYNAYRFAVRETGRLAVEFRINHPERGERWVLCRGKCMGSEGDGHGSRMVGMILDITERKHIEMQLKRMARRSAKEHNRRKELSKRMIDLLEADRRQIAMYLHDHIGQMLTTMKMDLERVESRLSDIRLLNDIDAAKEKAMEMMAGIRGIIQDLRPSTLDNLGLVPSIRTLMEKTEQTAESLHIHLYTRDIPQDLDLKKQLAIFRIVQEALTNILKHAQAGDVFINLVRRGKTLSLSIEDDGKGFDSEAFFTKRAGISSWGLLFMQERAVQAGGRFEVESHPHKGTFICVEIPV